MCALHTIMPRTCPTAPSNRILRFVYSTQRRPVFSFARPCVCVCVCVCVGSLFICAYTHSTSAGRLCTCPTAPSTAFCDLCIARSAAPTSSAARLASSVATRRTELRPRLDLDSVRAAASSARANAAAASATATASAASARDSARAAVARSCGEWLMYK